MKRLLCIVSSMDRGGAETFLMKLYRSLDTKKYQMDFCVSKKEKGFYDDEIKEKGGKIFYVPPKSKNPFKTFLSITKLVKKENYFYVLRTSQQSLAALDLLAAKLGGAKKLIYRSSNANITGGKIKKIVNKLFSFLPRIIPNVKIAPSTEAAMFVFSKQAVKNGKVTILPNALDYNLFAFQNEIRKKIRKELNISENIKVFGHVGRFNIQKNHEFLIKIFKEIHKKEKNSLLLLIGEGELEEKIKKQVEELNLTDFVLFLGPKANVNEYLMAMDALIFPSFFEGMPNVVIEAEASGLKCFVANTITKEANITGLVNYLDIQKSACFWADFILENINYERKNYEKEFRANKYIIEDVINLFISVIYDGRY